MTGKHEKAPLKFSEAHPLAASVALFAACLAGLVLLFVFLVFSDFSGSADFVYNSF